MKFSQPRSRAERSHEVGYLAALCVTLDAVKYCPRQLDIMTQLQQTLFYRGGPLSQFHVGFPRSNTPIAPRDSSTNAYCLPSILVIERESEIAIKEKEKKERKKNRRKNRGRMITYFFFFLVRREREVITNYPEQ